ncbi:hypothetical protein BC829DRAFT_176330 [Chytridium lagenaria]|nr:hypothetical protein BC829DRAFT_176330 [Chytridium lagenaria]
MFNPKPTEVTPTPPVPSLSNSSIHNSHNSSPPSMSRSLSTKSISASNKSLNTSPSKTRPTDVSTASLNRARRTLAWPLTTTLLPNPSPLELHQHQGGGFLSSKTPTTEKGGWFGKKGGAASGEFVSGDDAPPMPALPDHLRKPVLEARVETSVHKKRGGTLASWTSLD